MHRSNYQIQKSQKQKIIYFLMIEIAVEKKNLAHKCMIVTFNQLSLLEKLIRMS